MNRVRMHIIMDKAYHINFLSSLREICTRYDMVRSLYECKAYWKIEEKYEISAELNLPIPQPFSEWERIYTTLFRQSHSVEFFKVDNIPFCNLLYYTPCRDEGELMPEECFVELCIPESAITDIEARFPNRTY